MTADHSSPIPTDANEREIRRRLGIPDDAQRVLLISESSHWDPNWLMTSEEYWERFVRDNLDLALEALEENPRRIYSVECMFFLRMYWDRCPERRAAIRDLLNSGRLRLTHSGVTTADTLLPSEEALLRDWLIGQEWLRAQGIVQEPRLAYFADSFGCSPALPSLLNAAGFDRTAITRIDGMFFVGCDYESSSHFPRPGSSTEWLIEKEKTVDFYWQDANGAQALCHWNAFNYGQGDMLAHRGINRIYLINMAFSDSSERHVARRIQQFVDQLTPCSRTPYMFCPIGFDFVPPLPGLIDMLDRYNQVRYPTTGVWVVNAGLDDYLDLVECHRDKLPTLTLDPNPYWTGFYAARPTLKKSAHHLVKSLIVAEKLAIQHDPANAQQVAQQLAPSWWDAAVSNHHDFITGTSPDKVVDQEQMPSLVRAQEIVDGILKPYASHADTAQDQGEATTGRASDLRPEWHHTDTGLEIRTPYYVLELDAAAGGTIARAWHPETQHTLLGFGSGDLILYRGSGGTYRFGHEFVGGKFREVKRASTSPAQLLVQEYAQGIEVTLNLEIGGESFERRLWLSAHSPVIQMRVKGHAPDGHTVIVGLNTCLQTDTLTMDTPGGLIERPPQRIYTPTFWPLHRLLHLCDQEQPYDLTYWQAIPGAFTYSPDGTLQAVAVRNATKERAYGLLPIPANPVAAHENTAYAFDCALWFGERRDGPATDTLRVLGDAPVAPWVPDTWTSLTSQADQIVTADLPDVEVTAVKPASRGEGLIVRLSSLVPLHKTIQVRIRGHTVSQAWLCDARERDIEPISIRYGAANPRMDTTITTIRLLI